MINSELIMIHQFYNSFLQDDFLCEIKLPSYKSWNELFHNVEFDFFVNTHTKDICIIKSKQINRTKTRQKICNLLLEGYEHILKNKKFYKILLDSIDAKEICLVVRKT